jgi:3-oxoadipate enol-lactonase
MSNVISNIESGFALINNTCLYFEKSGTGKPIVFVHGMGLDCQMWEVQFFELAKQYQAIRYDLRGFGKSSLPTEQCYSHHNDLMALLNYLKISNASLIGHSMGGRVVTDFALTYPEMTTSLVLVNAALHGYVFKSFSLEKVIAAAKQSSIQSARKTWLAHALFNSANKNPHLATTLEKIVSSYSGWHWLNKNPWTPLNPPSMEQLNTIKTPTLITVGQLDLPDFHRIASILAKEISNSKKKEIPNVGHMSNMENPTEFNRIVSEFFHSIN